MARGAKRSDKKPKAISKRNLEESEDELLSAFSDAEKVYASPRKAPSKKQKPTVAITRTSIAPELSEEEQEIPVVEINFDKADRSVNELKLMHSALKADFEAFKKSSIKEAETAFNKYKKASEERDAGNLIETIANQELIQNLRKEIEDSKKALDEKNKELQLAKDEKSINSKHASLLEKFQKTTDFYSSISGISIHSVREAVDSENQPSTVFECEHRGRNGCKFLLTPALLYAIVVPEKGGYYSYVPNTSQSNLKKLALPDYLGEEIEFESDMVDMFFWRVCDWLQQPLD